MGLYRTLSFLLAATLLCSWSISASANVILNSGFEVGTGTDATDWVQEGGPSGSTTRSDSMPANGGFGAYMQADHFINPAAPTPYSFQQISPVGSIDGALNYNLSFSAKVDSIDFNGFDLFYQILWLDQDASDSAGGVQGEILTPLIPAGINASYQTFGLSDINVPDSADSFHLRFQLSPGAVENIANGLYIDDVSLAPAIDASLGDFDFDGDVDGDDFLVWQRTDGTGAALNNWQLNYGSTATSLTAASAVPEPSHLTLVIISCLLAAQKRDRT